MPVKKVKSPTKSAGRQKSKVLAKSQSSSLSKGQQSSGLGRKSLVAVKTSAPKRASLTVQVFTAAGRAAGEMQLPKEIFGAEVNKNLIAQAIRVYLANQRLGTASTKSRGEITASTRKIWRQKGTGRARHGALSAPLFVGGGVAHGPKPKDYSLKLPKKMKKIALICALSSKLNDGQIKVLTGFEKIEPKTKIMNAAIKSLDLERKKILLVTPATSTELPDLYKAARNIEGVKILPAQMLNTYEVLDNVSIFLMKASIEILKKNLIGGKE